MNPRFYFISAGVIFLAAVALIFGRQNYIEKANLAAPGSPLVIRPASKLAPRALPKPSPSYGHVSQGVQTHILMYHYIREVDPSRDSLGFRLSVTPNELEQQLQSLQEKGYESLTMDQVAAGIGGPKTVALTFDDGYEDFYTNAWPLLKKYGFNATIYIISSKIDGNYMTWDQIRELQKAGIQIGAHSVDHIDLSKATAASQQFQVDASKQTIEEQLGVPVTAFCYPSGKFTQLTVQFTQEAGYTTATTTEPGSVHVGDNPFLLHRVRINPGMTGDAFWRDIQN